MEAVKSLEQTEFERMFVHAVGLYPGSGTHEGSAASYWQHLRRYPVTVLRSAFRQAVNSSPQFFPSAVTIAQCAESASKTAALPKADYSRPALTDGGREFVPAIGAGQEEWIAEGANDGERLARLWQVESKHQGWDRGKEMPIEIGKRRFQELSVILNKIGSKTVPMFGSRLEGSGSTSTGSGSNGSPRSARSSVGERSHGDGCVCEPCYAKVMKKARSLGL